MTLVINKSRCPEYHQSFDNVELKAGLVQNLRNKFMALIEYEKNNSHLIRKFKSLEDIDQPDTSLRLNNKSMENISEVEQPSSVEYFENRNDLYRLSLKDYSESHYDFAALQKLFGDPIKYNKNSIKYKGTSTEDHTSKVQQMKQLFSKKFKSNSSSNIRTETISKPSPIVAKPILTKSSEIINNTENVQRSAIHHKSFSPTKAYKKSSHGVYFYYNVEKNESQDLMEPSKELHTPKLVSSSKNIEKNEIANNILSNSSNLSSKDHSNLSKNYPTSVTNTFTTDSQNTISTANQSGTKLKQFPEQKSNTTSTTDGYWKVTRDLVHKIRLKGKSFRFENGKRFELPPPLPSCESINSADITPPSLDVKSMISFTGMEPSKTNFICADYDMELVHTKAMRNGKSSASSSLSTSPSVPSPDIPFTVSTNACSIDVTQVAKSPNYGMILNNSNKQKRFKIKDLDTDEIKLSSEITQGTNPTEESVTYQHTNSPNSYYPNKVDRLFYFNFSSVETTQSNSNSINNTTSIISDKQPYSSPGLTTTYDFQSSTISQTLTQNGKLQDDTVIEFLGTKLIPPSRLSSTAPLQTSPTKNLVYLADVTAKTIDDLIETTSAQINFSYEDNQSPYNTFNTNKNVIISEDEQLFDENDTTNEDDSDEEINALPTPTNEEYVRLTNLIIVHGAYVKLAKHSFLSHERRLQKSRLKLTFSSHKPDLYEYPSEQSILDYLLECENVKARIQAFNAKAAQAAREANEARPPVPDRTTKRSAKTFYRTAPPSTTNNSNQTDNKSNNLVVAIKKKNELPDFSEAAINSHNKEDNKLVNNEVKTNEKRLDFNASAKTPTPTKLHINTSLRESPARDSSSDVTVFPYKSYISSLMLINSASSSSPKNKPLSPIVSSSTPPINSSQTTPQNLLMKAVETKRTDQTNYPPTAIATTTVTPVKINRTNIISNLFNNNNTSNNTNLSLSQNQSPALINTKAVSPSPISEKLSSFTPKHMDFNMFTNFNKTLTSPPNKTNESDMAKSTINGHLNDSIESSFETDYQKPLQAGFIESDEDIDENSLALRAAKWSQTVQTSDLLF